MADCVGGVLLRCHFGGLMSCGKWFLMWLKSEFVCLSFGDVDVGVEVEVEVES